MEASAFHHPARDAPAVASPGIQAVLEIQVQSSICQTKDLRRNRGFHQGNGRAESAFGELSVFVVNYSSWAFISLHVLLPTPGPPNNYGRRLLMDNRRTISFVIGTTSLDPVSRAWPQPAASRCSPRLTMRHEPMRSVSGFWGVCGESVSITFSSSRRSSWTVSFMPMSSTSIKPGRIKASDNSFQNSLVSLFNQITMVERSSPSRSWVDYTTIIAEVLELLRVCEEADGSVGWSAFHLGSRIPSVLFCRFL